MAAQTQADDETIFNELQKLLIRYNNYQLSYASLSAVTALGEFSRMNLPGVSQVTVNAKLYGIALIRHCKICLKWLLRKFRCDHEAEEGYLNLFMATVSYYPIPFTYVL
jgi:hypothetical protein